MYLANCELLVFSGSHSSANLKQGEVFDSSYSVLKELNLGVNNSSSTNSRSKQALSQFSMPLTQFPARQGERTFHCLYNLPTVHIKRESGKIPQRSKFRPACGSRGLSPQRNHPHLFSPTHTQETIKIFFTRQAERQPLKGRKHHGCGMLFAV